MIEGFMHFFDGAERPFDFAFGSGGHPGTVAAFRHMDDNLNPQVIHDLQENTASGNRASITIELGRNPLEDELDILFRRHCRKHESQRRFHIFAVDAVIFLIGYPASVINYAVNH